MSTLQGGFKVHQNIVQTPWVNQPVEMPQAPAMPIMQAMPEMPIMQAMPEMQVMPPSQTMCHYHVHCHYVIPVNHCGCGSPNPCGFGGMHTW